MVSVTEWSRAKWNRYSRSPFGQLVRLFAGRILHGGNDEELDLGMGLVLSIIAVPGALYSIFLLNKYSSFLQFLRGQSHFDPVANALPDEYFFIVLSMVVTGGVAVWRWENVFPDRRDYTNLVPLPISTRDIFLSNFAAIIGTALLLALDVNSVSAVLFPFVVSESTDGFAFFTHFVWVHALVVIGASVFSFLAVFVMVGSLMVLLPNVTFKRISLYLRGFIVACLIAMLMTSFVIPSTLSKLPNSFSRFLPSVWFVGLCQLMRGRATAALAHLGWLAIVACVCVVISAIAIYILSYRRCFIKIPETADSIAGGERVRAFWIFEALDRTILRSAPQRAGYRFVMKTLFRSEMHSLIVVGFLGLGIVVTSQFLFSALVGKTLQIGGIPPAEVLAAPLILSYCIALGVRFSFDIPVEIRANWPFRLMLNRFQHECVPLARKVIMSFILPWLILLIAPIYGYLWGWKVGVLQLVLVTTWSFILAEILLLQFRKVPFTCAYPPFRESAVVYLAFYVLGFFVFVTITSYLESWALDAPIREILFLAIALIAIFAILEFNKKVEEIDKELIFEEMAPVAVEPLNLQRGS